jgi:heme/copper-type cytochrome/quinol oxidase subunit 3
MSPVVPLEAEAPEVLNSNISVGARLAASATAFFFMAFVFAFFYLRALNTAHSFREIAGTHVNPPVGWGVVVLALVLLSIVALFGASRQVGEDGKAAGWRTGALLSWVLALASIVAQLVEYYNLHFGATDGGLASVFFLWTAVLLVFMLAAVYWIETMWAQSVRGERPSDIANPARTLAANASGCLVYLYTLAVAELFAFVLLYLVK